MKSWDDDMIIIGGNDDDNDNSQFTIHNAQLKNVDSTDVGTRHAVSKSLQQPQKTIPPKPKSTPNEITKEITIGGVSQNDVKSPPAASAPQHKSGQNENPPESPQNNCESPIVNFELNIPPSTKKLISTEIAPTAIAKDAGLEIFNRNLLVASSPHLHSGESTSVIMQDVLIALIPAAIISAIYFGLHAVMLMAVCIASCVAFEYISRRVMKRRNTISDFSAAVTGMLLAFCLPPELNPIYAIIGCAVAIVVVKQMFGGIGMNFANPAATARVALLLSFTAPMTTYSYPFFYLGRFTNPDAVTTATPLLLQKTTSALRFEELLIGNHAGSLGETCALALLLGGGFLVYRRVITLHIPLSIFGTVALLSILFGENPLDQLLSGGMMLGAIFMATDYSTSPSNKSGKIIFGIGCGLFTMIIRLFAKMPEGVSFAILLMNILSPHIDNLCAEKPFGMERKKD